MFVSGGTVTRFGQGPSLKHRVDGSLAIFAAGGNYRPLLARTRAAAAKGARARAASESALVASAAVCRSRVCITSLALAVKNVPRATAAWAILCAS